MSNLSPNFGGQNAFFRIFVVFIGVCLLSACASTPRPQPGKEPPRESCEFYQKGLASWYGYELFGNHTANGEKFDPEGITAAHRTLPFGTMLRVYMDNGRGNPEGVLVRINDRGPFIKGRVIDLSLGAARELGMKDTKPVTIYRCGS